MTVPLWLDASPEFTGCMGWSRSSPRRTPWKPFWAIPLGSWVIKAEVRTAVEGRRHGKGLVARIVGCEDREQAAVLVGQNISVSRDQLPPPGEDEFYWVDLEGLAVETLEGVPLGKVHHLFATAGQRCPGGARGARAPDALCLGRCGQGSGFRGGR